MEEGESDSFLRDILLSVRTIAMAGASDKPHRPSFGVFEFLLSCGYHVTGINPNLAGKSVHGTLFYGSLAEVPEPIDMVDIFRNSQAAGDTVDEALALNPRPKVIWMQLGVRNDAGAARARALGLKVVMDRCPAIEIRRLGIERSEARLRSPS
jgi:predicted CoA-binding protein